MKDINSRDWEINDGIYSIGIMIPIRNDFVKSGAGKKSNPKKSPASIDTKATFSSNLFL